jgi:hypothetical protein
MQVREIVLAAMLMTQPRWVPATKREVDELAPLVDTIYERAAGLDGDVDPQVRPMLEALMPSVDARRALAEGLVDMRRIEGYTKNLDLPLWLSIAAPVMAYVQPKQFGVRARRKDMRTPQLAAMLPKAELAPKNLREVPNE